MNTKQVAASVLDAFRGALADVSPRSIVRKALQVRDGRLLVGGREHTLDRNVRLVAFGKAAVEMVRGAEEALDAHVADGIASVPHRPTNSTEFKTEFFEGGADNLPDAAAVENTRRILRFLADNRPESLVLFLVSGGGSALLCSPVDGITLDEKLETTRLLASNGADITQLNTVRQVLSKVKGGKLAAHGISLIISDIVGGRIEKVSSGPTVAQECRPQDAADVMRRLGVWERAPAAVRRVIESTPPSNDASRDAPVENLLVCDNRRFLSCMSERLEAAGLPTTIVTAELEGNAEEVGAKLAAPLAAWIGGRDAEITPPFGSQSSEFRVPSEGSFAWLFGGETVVRFPPDLPAGGKPKGGRNQELALSVLRRLLGASAADRSDRSFACFSLGTDGQDGPTDAAGAFVIAENLREANDELRADVRRHLEQKTSYEFWLSFEAGAQLVKCGKTGHNLMDCILLVFLHP
ncbi:hypothetical protein M3Y99_00595400 [Aphelenchoides fujianensis]|nr:hypothetical protein M3Y99_01034500 [Aphelenchoides fujianensis]KAI6239211.1 hypothetical protein M3Y99_00595400 [Aphelenchoides fujianensis]